MARAFAKVKGTVWRDSDWRDLEPDEQWAYILLLSQPQINNCGVLPYVVTRWARLAAGLTVDAVNHLMEALDRAGFVVVDEETAEVLVRTFIKHDEVERQPNLLKAAKRQYHEIQSPRIRASLVVEYPHIFDPIPGDNARLNEPLPKPLPEGLSEPLSEGVRNGLDKPNPEGVPEGDSNPRARARKPPSPSQHPVDSNPQQQTAPNGSADAAAEDLQELQAAGWSPAQIATLTTPAELERAVAWLHHARTDPAVKNPAGLAWSKTNESDTWPEAERTEIAKGAIGVTRSYSPQLPDRPAEPDLERIPPPPDFLALAGIKPEPTLDEDID